MEGRRERLERICQQSGVVTLYIFGSQAQKVRDWLVGLKDDLPKGSSDVDVGVRSLSGKSWSIAEKVSLAMALEDLFDGMRADLVLLSEADPFLAVEIIRGERLYARDEHEADEYDLYILRRAGDLIPLERERMSLVLGEPK